VYIEAFSAGKDPLRPWENEDRVVAYGQRTFAVIDGVTDKSGRLYEGRTGGWHAGHAVEGALREMTDEGRLADGEVAAIVDGLNGAIAERHRRFGIEAECAAEANLRCSAAAVLAHLRGDDLRLVLIGDCGARIDGARVVRQAHRADEVMGKVRATVFEALAELAPHTPLERRLALARAYVVHGLAERPPGSADEVDEPGHRRILARVRSSLEDAFGDIAPETRDALLVGGILGAARQRNGDGPLAHGVLDGFPLPLALVAEVHLDARAFHTLELFSDGYFGLPDASGRVAAWEAHIAEVERVDPHRVGRYASTKGSHEGRRADDRSVLILRREPHHDEAA
jgi:hypothetical protein